MDPGVLDKKIERFLRLFGIYDDRRQTLGLLACLGVCISLRRRRLASSTPLTYEAEVEATVQVLGVMRT